MLLAMLRQQLLNANVAHLVRVYGLDAARFVLRSLARDWARQAPLTMCHQKMACLRKKFREHGRCAGTGRRFKTFLGLPPKPRGFPQLAHFRRSRGVTLRLLETAGDERKPWESFALAVAHLAEGAT